MRKTGEGLSSLNGNKDARDKIISRPFEMLRKSMDRRVNLMTKVFRMKETGAASPKRKSGK